MVNYQVYRYKHLIRSVAYLRVAGQFGFEAPGFSPAQPQNADLKVGATPSWPITYLPRTRCFLSPGGLEKNKAS
jgi:hypothetical protein